MNVKGYCNACNCHFSKHERCRYIYEEEYVTTQIDIQAIKKDFSMKQLEAEKVVIFKYIDELIICVQ